MLLHVDDDVEIAGRSAGGPVFTLAVQPQALAGGDPGGNLRGDLAIAPDASRAPARLARLADHAAGAAAVRAGARNGQESLLEAQLARALAVPAHFRGAAGSRAEPLQVSHVSSRGIWIVVSLPVNDSSNEISRS